MNLPEKGPAQFRAASQAVTRLVLLVAGLGTLLALAFLLRG